MRQKTKEEIGKELYRLPLLDNLMQIYSAAFMFISVIVHPAIFLVSFFILVIVVAISIKRKMRDWKIYFHNKEQTSDEHLDKLK